MVPSINGDYQRGVNALWRVLRMALRYRVRFPAAVIAAGVFQLLIPLYLGAAIDQALGLVSGAKTGGATVAQAESALVTSALLVLGIAVMRLHPRPQLPRGIDRPELRLRAAARVLREAAAASFSYHERMHSGDLITRGMLRHRGRAALHRNRHMRLFQLSVLAGRLCEFRAWKKK
jgi:ATP-binding cassette subfamily B protein